MRFPRAIPIGLVPVLAACVMWVSLGAVASASADAGPQWRIVSVPTPTNFVPGTPTSELEDVTISATGGTFKLSIGLGSDVFTTAPIAYDAPAATVQSELEALRNIGAGNVAVTGGPGGSAPYAVAFTGELADVDLNAPPVEIGSLRADGEELTAPGGQGSAAVTIARRGTYPPSFLVTATNVGGGAADGASAPIAITDALPPGISAVHVSGYDAYASQFAINGHGSTPLSCAELIESPAVKCTYAGVVDPGDMLVMRVTAAVQPSLGEGASVINRVAVSGGGAAAAASAEGAVKISAAPAPFGVAPGSVFAIASSEQAGGHPDLTTAFTLNTTSFGEVAGTPKDIRFELPPGLVGTTVGMPRCTMAAVGALSLASPEECPANTIVGTATVMLANHGGIESLVTPVYNIAPAPGEPLALAFNATIDVRLDTSVLSNGDYAARVTAPDLTEASHVLSTWITVWGVPADHNGPGQNGEDTIFGQSFGGHGAGEPRVALLTSPQQCSTPLSASMETDPWAAQGDFTGPLNAAGEAEPFQMGELTGCDLLSVAPSFQMLPDTLQAGAPAGYSLDLRVAQNTDPDGLATPDVKRVSTTLPLGTVISPSAADGLVACSDALFGLHSGVPARCPSASQVGTVQIKSPAIEETLQGAVYLGEPSCAICTPADAQDGRMVRLFVQVQSEGEAGIVVKLEGNGYINQQTGQITTVFDENPQLPFSELKLALGGGERATLANPRTCGPASTNIDLTAWSTPFTADATPHSTFDVTGCPGAQFAPTFTAGTTSNQAGGFSPLTVSFSRSDSEQMMSGIKLTFPPGLLASVVTKCEEPQASQGACGAGSLIGHVNVLTGPGADPFLVQGGQVFFTGPYKGAPFGLSIVVPAKAGPYTLSGTTGTGLVVVRAAVNVDPHTSQLSVTSDPFPRMLDGIPLQLRRVDVMTDRPGFIFNPTNCDPLAVGGLLSSAEGMSSQVSYHFQVTNCAGLKFKPVFKVSTSGKTSRADGASLDAKVTYPTGAQGTQANIAKVKVDLPKQLPSRLTTLQKACPAATFEANPAGCPAASVVGVVKASTPVLPVGLTGPVYFVSHGGEAFPNLIVVLQGSGVRVDLVGDTFISKAGITSSTFAQVPDVPISAFELYLPEGPHSALAANGNLCKSKLAMPTAFTAQNGAVIHESTKIAVTGCPRVKAKAAQKARSAKGKRAVVKGGGE